MKIKGPTQQINPQNSLSGPSGGLPMPQQTPTSMVISYQLDRSDCDSKQLQKSDVKTLIKIAYEGDSNVKKYKCNYCATTFPCKENLKNHQG